MDYKASFYETTEANVMNTQLRPIVPGQYIVCVDSGRLYYDTKKGERKCLSVGNRLTLSAKQPEGQAVNDTWLEIIAEE